MRVSNRTGVTCRLGGYTPCGASLQNASRSLRRNACTPVKLKWVNRGQLFNSTMMLWLLLVINKYGDEGFLLLGSGWCSSLDVLSPSCWRWLKSSPHMLAQADLRRPGHISDVTETKRRHSRRLSYCILQGQYV